MTQIYDSTDYYTDTSGSGGLHLLFASKPAYAVHLPSHAPDSSPPRPTNLADLIQYMKTNLLTEREEMFIEGDSV
jgi:ubiquitin related modifier 1